jgi:hypothetical protein
VGQWTAIGVAVSIIVQIIVGAWVISAMYTRITDLETRVAHVEQTKVGIDTITPQLDEINRRLAVIEAQTLDHGGRR